MASKTFERHIKAIHDNAVTATNVIGLRKIFNAQSRRDRGYRDNVNPKIEPQEVEVLAQALWRFTPTVRGKLHTTGLDRLLDPRYARRWSERERAIIADLDHFRLVGFHQWDGRSYTPIYRAYSRRGDSFAYIHPSWQSGGRGPEVVDGY